MPPLPLPRSSSHSRLSHLLRAQSHHATSFDYTLPSSSIALHPLPDRSSSRLLVVPNGHAPRHHKFSDLPSLLPSSALLVRNTSRVIPARIQMRKRDTHGRVQLMLLHPLHMRPPEAMNTVPSGQIWQAFLGGRRLRVGDVLQSKVGEGILEATVLEREGSGAKVQLGGVGLQERGFGDLLGTVGETPLPPYIKRDVEERDRVTYQTVYAEEEGSVAAPTAGLHVTEQVLDELQQKGIAVESVVLHVGAGTFAQLEGDVGGHFMHEEGVGVEVALVETLEKQIVRGGGIVALGTTSVRTLESLYWFGVRLLCEETKRKNNFFFVAQWEPYERLDELGENNLPTAAEALRAILKWNSEQGGNLRGQTRLLIVPGYQFQMVDAMVTNFHQPRSTLPMLVSAFHGGQPEDLFRIYEEAIHHGYRFLSYGDSSIYASPDFFDNV